ncbi:MAG: D-glycero-beta-D-manno-heptose 1-phosphate adenylyltransferase [Bacteroidota bacterium]
MKTAKKILNLEQAINLRKQWYSENQTVVFTNGCFDILHLGHVDYLEKAKEKGDKLILGLNSDSSVRQLKGESRPINSEMARARILAALEFIDMVIIFSEETPLNLILNLKPNVLIKGGDYSIENIVGAKEVLANGGKVETIEFVPNYSTTTIINKIQQ